MLEVENVGKRYRGIPAIQNISFRVGTGEVVGYLGPNGSGKSTTVKIITAQLKPNDGRVLFNGRNILEDLKGFRTSLGYVPEEAHVYGHLSGLEYLQLIGRLRELPESLIERRAQGMLELFGLRAWRHTPLSSYSKGMKQRVLISSALMHDPKLLVFDEPLSGLDVLSARIFKDLLIALSAEGKAILYISHALEVVEQVCNRVIVLAEGEIRADAALSQLKELMKLRDLESVFAQLVQQVDTSATAGALVRIMSETHV